MSKRWGGKVLLGLGLGVFVGLGSPVLPALSGPELLTAGGGSGVAWGEEAPPPGLDILVFVDETGSTSRQFDVYRRALLDRIIPGLKQGDRLRVLPITDDNSLISDFMAEGTLAPKPPFDSLSDNELDYKAKMKALSAKNDAIRQQLLDTMKKKLAKPGKSKYTDLFGAARMTSQLFSADKMRPVAVFLSDMQEDRGRFRYNTMTFGKKDLDRVGKAYGFPDLKHVCVYVVGTRSPSIERTRKMIKFWEKYFEKSGADITPDHMVSMLVNWPPPDGCGSPRVTEKKGSWLDRIKKQL